MQSTALYVHVMTEGCSSSSQLATTASTATSGYMPRFASSSAICL